MTKTHVRAAAVAETTARGAVVQRACACGQHHAGTEPCEGCRRRAALMHGLTDSAPEEAPSLVWAVIRSDGDPLDSQTRTFFESRFGHDLGRVRVHTGAQASASARAVDAQAYTVGSHVVYDTGRFNPASGPGRELLAHELIHTLQQRGANPYAPDGVQDRRDAPSTADASEREASAIARTLTSRAVGISRPAVAEPMALRRQSNAAAAAARTSSAGGVEPVKVVPEVPLGRFTESRQGFADARLDRRPALTSGQPTDTPPPCQLDLLLKLGFDFHLGPAPYRDPDTGDMTPMGTAWPIERSNRWKRDYMRVAQDMWRTRHALERKGDCPNEPCKRAVGQLRVVDVDTMRDSSGQVVEGISNVPHMQVTVYEFRPATGKDYSHVESGATLFDEDVLPLSTPPPKGFNKEKYVWRPGAAAHETGHMLGRPEVACPPGVKKPQEECYGEGAQRDNVMGRGTEFSREDHARFIAGMKAATGCDWEVPSGGLPWWAILLISLTGIGAIVLGIMALAGAL